MTCVDQELPPVADDRDRMLLLAENARQDARTVLRPLPRPDYCDESLIITEKDGELTIWLRGPGLFVLRATENYVASFRDGRWRRRLCHLAAEALEDLRQLERAAFEPVDDAGLFDERGAPV